MPQSPSLLPPRPGASRACARWLHIAGALCAALLAEARPAAAYDIEIASETIGQGYQILGANGGVISRRRLDQYLGLSVWNLGPKDAAGLPLLKNQWYFTSSFRLQFDFGDWAPSGGTWGGRDISKEITNNQLEILYAYVGARDLGGFLDLQLGRQIDYDAFQFLSYDGLHVVAKTPWNMAVDAYGGLLVNGFLPVDSPIFRPDGTAPGALSIHDSEAKPVIGVGIRSFGYRDLDAHFSYRQIFSPGAGGGCISGNTDIGNLERCAGVKDGTTEQKLSWNGRARLWGGRIVPWLGLRYDLLLGVLDTVQAGVRVALADKHGLTAEYFYSYPTFDGDSIFNLFARSNFDDIRVGYDLRQGALRFYARGFLRLFHDTDVATDRYGGPAPVSPGGTLDGGANIGARYDFHKGYLRADGYLEEGWGGSRIGVDLSTRWKVYQELFSLEGRALYAHFEDDARGNPEADRGDSLGLQVGGRLQLGRGVLIHLLVEDNINRYYASQIRVYGLLDVSALMGSNGIGLSPPRGLGAGLGQFGNAYGTGRGY